MRRAVIWAAAVLLLLAAGGTVLFFALQSDAPPWEQRAMDLIQAVNDGDDAALRGCLLVARLRPEDRTAYGYPDVALAVPEAANLRTRLEDRLKTEVKYRLTGYALISDEIVVSRQFLLTVSLSSVETAGCTAALDPESDRITYDITLYLRMHWTDQDGAAHVDILTFSDLRALEYRGEWYLTGV